MKKKVLLIVLPIIMAIAIATAIIVAVIVSKNKEDETVGTKWGDTYYAYLKEAINEDDLNTAEEKYGMILGMKNVKIQFCEVDEGQDPTMIMTYEKENNTYVNVYQINDKKKVDYIAYKQPTEVEYLYNIEDDEYSWYIHVIGTDSDSYSSLKNISSRMKDKAKESTGTKDAYVAETVADYTIKKDEAKITQETVNGEKIELDKFDEIFVRPEIEQNEQIDFNLDMTEKELKKSLKKIVDNFVKKTKKVTDDIKEQVAKKVEETKSKKEQIETAKTDVENKKKAEEYSKGLKVGNATLKYGVYTYSDDGSFSPGRTLRGEITLKPNGEFHIKSNFDEMSGQAASYDEDGTYTVALNQDDGYGGKTNYINFKGNKSYSMYFVVYKDNSFSDQWHFYNLTRELKAEEINQSSSTSNSDSSEGIKVGNTTIKHGTYNGEDAASGIKLVLSKDGKCTYDGKSGTYSVGTHDFAQDESTRGSIKDCLIIKTDYTYHYYPINSTTLGDGGINNFIYSGN